MMPATAYRKFVPMCAEEGLFRDPVVQRNFESGGTEISAATTPARRVLVVEDDPDCRIIYFRLLQHAGYTVLEAGDGEQAVQSARTYLPDLILLDLRLPVMDGWAAARQLKADPSTSAIPLMAFTAQVLPGNRERAGAAGFVGYFDKPVHPTDVLHAIRQCIGPALPSANA